MHRIFNAYLNRSTSEVSEAVTASFAKTLSSTDQGKTRNISCVNITAIRVLNTRLIDIKPPKALASIVIKGINKTLMIANSLITMGNLSV